MFASGYGDCKDKATLLSALLHEVGIDSYYVLINNNRDYLSPDFPSMLAFNHVILAILLPDPADTTSTMPILRHEKLGRLLLFDPTDDSTPLGYLPPSLQASQGLLVTDGEGELVNTPLLPPLANRIHRTAKLSLDTTGVLKGTIEEIRFGPFATTLRDSLLNVPAKQRQTILQSMLTEMIDGAVLTGAHVGGLHDSAAAMTVSYDVTVPAYAQHTGNLFLFRPCVLGHKGSSILEGKPRQQPLVFPYAASERDVVEISLPAEYSTRRGAQGRHLQLPIRRLQERYQDLRSRTPLQPNLRAERGSNPNRAAQGSQDTLLRHCRRRARLRNSASPLAGHEHRFTGLLLLT